VKITKLVHSCLLVEMPEPVNRTALFDPGVMSTVDIDNLAYLDDIFITHSHGDHLDPGVVKQLVAKFPNVRITTTSEVVEQLQEQGITASTEAPEGVSFFDSPHEDVMPLFPAPEEIGVHYLDIVTHPGDSHSFTETGPLGLLGKSDESCTSVKAEIRHPYSRLALARRSAPTDV
jgi:L-ascorbate metabolism protein UlaG (beta-lactamase superfamily)